MKTTRHEIEGHTITLRPYLVDGFQMTVCDPDGKTVYDNRMIGYTYYDAISVAEAVVKGQSEGGWADSLGYEPTADE